MTALLTFAQRAATYTAWGIMFYVVSLVGAAVRHGIGG
jgi:hypothetical protein